MPCHNLGSGIIVCTSPPSRVMDSEPCEVRWCFKCREHRMHLMVVMDPASPWFDTEFRLLCDQCGELATDMNGNCVDLGKWTPDMKAAWERLCADDREWEPRVRFCWECQSMEPTPGAFKDGLCGDPECIAGRAEKDEAFSNGAKENPQ